MLFILPILFKIIPPNNISGIIHQKGGTPPGYCTSASNRAIIDVDPRSTFFNCDSSIYTITIEKVTFLRCCSSWNWFAEFKYASLNVKACTFESCTYEYRFISVGDHNSNSKLSFVSNTITNCYEYDGRSSESIRSHYPYNYISQNSISFDSHKARGFYFLYDRGLTFTGNSIRNGYSDYGAGGLQIEGGHNYGFSPLVFSDCVFSNIDGDRRDEHFATTVFIYRLGYDLTITNVTFEHLKKIYSPNGFGKGYMFQVDPQTTYTRPYITFKKCKFSYLEFNGQNGGGIGMFIRKPPEDKNTERYIFTIKYEDTTFEHLRYQLDSWGGGAISVSHDVGENKHTNIYVNNCTFKNVSSKGNQAGGGAIYFNSPGGTLEVKKSKFVDTYPRDTGQVGGAIFVKYDSGNMISNIYDCVFENTRANYGGAIYIRWNTDLSTDITISGCTFRRTYAYSDSNSILLDYCYNNNVNINNNKFIDCRNKADTFAVFLDVQRLNFNYNQIIFSKETESCGCVVVYTITQYTFNGNLFQNARCSTSYAAGIHFNNFYPYSTLTVQNNTFKQIQGRSEGRCIYIDTISSSSSNAVIFRNNTIEDCPEGGNFIRFNFQYTISQYTVESCRFIRNKVNGNCVSQLWIQNVKTLIYSGCYFESNMNTAKNGGAIRYYNNADLIQILKCEFYDNKAKVSGSAISIETTAGCEIKECTFARNACESGSGSIFTSLTSAICDMTISQCVFDSNTANVNGAAILFQGNLGCSINECNFSGNACTTGSGTIYLEFQSTNKNVNINKCNFDDNIANKDGSSIYIQANSYCEINDCNFSRNTCQTGSGPITCIVKATCNIIKSNFNDNTAQTDGGAIVFQATDGEINECTFTRNTCNTGSGTISYSATNTKIIKCDFIGNTVQTNGAAVLSYSILGCEFTECTFVKNTCKDGCGTIHIEIANSNQNIEINKCEFNESQSQNAHCIEFFDPKNAIINIKECNFNDCGSNRCMIRVQTIAKQILLQNCSIYFSKDQTTIGLLLNSDRISLIGNTFQHFRNAVVHFPCISTDEKIEVVENFFIDCSESPVFDITNYLKTSPTFVGNTFDNIHSSYPVLRLKFEDSISSIVFDNNTFRNFDTNNDFGGIGLEIDHSSNEYLFNVSFTNCYFIDNANTNKQQDGGALSFGLKQNNGNLCLYLFECLFEHNQNENKGSSLFLNIQHEICIECCQFIENPESNGTIYIEPDCGNDPQQSSILITNCLFRQNKGGESSTIHIAPSTSKTVMIISCTFDEDEGGIYVDSIRQEAEITRNTMIGIKVSPALTIKQYPKFEALVKGCTFDSCTTDNNQCFNIFTLDSTDEYPNEYQFTDNIIQNNIAHGHTSYIGSFICNERIHSLKIENISFINNTCDCLYGGGIGIKIKDVKSDLHFTDCLFMNNSAKQNQEISRPTNNPNIKYYNGDGGGIQLGYACSMNSVDVYFIGCTFENNRAERHGGAISIQTTKYVELFNCRFENNEANHRFEESSAELLVDNYFHLKSEGRGGAIYINPSYTYDSCTISHYMQNVKISECEFISNNGYDGYGIYVEGDDVGTKFDFKQNIFTDNFNESNHNEDANDIYGAVITTEINAFVRQQIIDDNTFNYSKPELKVLEISLVDHYGKTPSKAFSKSDAFTESNDFTSTDHFSNLAKFTESKMFSESDSFSNSRHFSQSSHFTDNLISSSGENTELSPDETKESSEVTTKSTEEIIQLSTKETTELSPDEITESIEVIIQSTEEITKLSTKKTIELSPDETKETSELTTKSTEEITQLSTDGKKSEETIPDASTGMSNDHDLFHSAMLNEPNSPNKNAKKTNSTIIIVVVVIVVAVLILASVLTFAILYKKKRKEKKEEEITSRETSPTNKTTRPEAFSDQDDDDSDLNFWL